MDPAVTYSPGLQANFSDNGRLSGRMVGTAHSGSAGFTIPGAEKRCEHRLYRYCKGLIYSTIPEPL